VCAGIAQTYRDVAVRAGHAVRRPPDARRVARVVRRARRVPPPGRCLPDFAVGLLVPLGATSEPVARVAT